MEQIGSVLAKQREFFQTGKTREVPFRLEMLARLRSAMEKYEEPLADALQADLGKSRFEGFMCEYGLTLTELTYMQKHMRRLAKGHVVSTPITNFAARSFRSPTPYGNVLIMSPWNYPILLTIEPLIDALAAGNTAVVKPSAYSPETSAVLCRMLRETFGEEYVAVVTGGREENQSLLHQRFDKIFFTGGKNVGREVLRCAAEHLTPVTLELGGKSPVIVDDTAKIDLAARRIVWGKYLNLGQTCVAPDYVLCVKGVRDRLLEALKREITRQYGPDPLGSASYGKMINEKHFDRVMGLIDQDKVAFGGKADRARLRIAPTVLRDVTWDDAVMGEEIFGPVLPILTVDSVDEAIAMVNDHPHPLALYVFSQDRQAQKRVLKLCRFGGGCINDTIVHLATNSMPFGGMGESGMGAYHGKYGFECFSHYRSIVDKKTWIDVPMRYQPVKGLYEKMLHLFLR